MKQAFIVELMGGDESPLFLCLSGTWYWSTMFRLAKDFPSNEEAIEAIKAVPGIEHRYIKITPLWIIE